MKQAKTTLDLTEEIATFSELRQHLLRRLNKAEGIKRTRLKKQASIIQDHLLSLFQRREKLS